MGLVLAALIESTSARSMELATILAEALDVQLGSALNRFYRLLRNPRIDDLLLCVQMLTVLGGRMGQRALIAVDWTEWHSDLRLLSACELADRRAIPVFTVGVDKNLLPRSQNSTENTFVRLLADALSRAGRRGLILADRGFRRVTWLKLLEQLRLEYVVRLKGDVCVEQNGRWVSLDALGLQPGQRKDLGCVALRKGGAYFTRVVALWAPGAAQPWFLATNLRAGIAKVAALYDRRMAIEEQFRDTKGCRFGLKLEWTQIKTAPYLARFAMLLGVAILAWSAAGFAATKKRKSLRLPHPTKGPRQSYVTIGMRALRLGTVELRLSAAALVRWLFKPRLRFFAWPSVEEPR